jgi:N-formylglutamate amidohydrolase
MEGKKMTVAEAKQRVHDEWDWFESCRRNIIEGHKGEWVVIRHHAVQGYFPTMQAGQAFMKAQGIVLGDYITQPCKTKEEELAENFMGLALPGGRYVTPLV